MIPVRFSLATLLLFSPIITITTTHISFVEGFFHNKDSSVSKKFTAKARTTSSNFPLLNGGDQTETSDSKMISKIQTAKSLFGEHFDVEDSTEQERSEDFLPITAAIAVAPGRVNLIGEHTDYTGGFVLPFAIEYSTVVYGKGSVKLNANENGERKAKISFVSTTCSDSLQEFEVTESSVPPETPTWTTYVVGTVFQYLQDLPAGSEVGLKFCIAGDVPLGSGLSSSASLEVAVGRFVEAVLGEYAFSSEKQQGAFSPSKTRALRCQKAENKWCNSPCGIMDQAVSSAAISGSLMLIDCRNLDFTPTKMANESISPDFPLPVLVVANSNVKHSIGGGEYPVRVAQCKAATEAIQKVNPLVSMLRDASMEDVENAKQFMNEVEYNRAKHVISENDRTIQAKEELERGDWKQVGELMNESHASMRDDYEVSCEEVDILVDIAQKFPGVYGSRLTGGGFGGCTVTLVAGDCAEALVARMKSEYKEKTGLDCPCFVTRPARGAHLLSIDTFKPMVPE